MNIGGVILAGEKWRPRIETTFSASLSNTDKDWK